MKDQHLYQTYSSKPGALLIHPKRFPNVNILFQIVIDFVLQFNTVTLSTCEGHLCTHHFKSDALAHVYSLATKSMFNGFTVTIVHNKSSMLFKRKCVS